MTITSADQIYVEFLSKLSVLHGWIKCNHTVGSKLNLIQNATKDGIDLMLDDRIVGSCKYPAQVLISVDFEIAKCLHVHEQDDIFYFKLALPRFHGSSTSDDAIRKPCAVVDVQTSVHDIQCSKCSNPLMNSPDLLDRIADLPSERWEEFLDCWVCHPSDSERHFSKMKLRDGIERTLMSGHNYWMLPCSLITHSVSSISDDNTTESIACSNCKSIVGVRPINSLNVDNKIDTRNVAPPQPTGCKLLKYKVDLVLTDGTRQCASFKDCLLYEMFENYRAHAYSRFMICSSDGQSSLALWIMNWDWICGFKGVDMAVELLPSVKVFYSFLNLKEESNSKTIDLHASWREQCDNKMTGSQQLVELLECEPELVQSIVDMLDANFERMLGGRTKSMNGMRPSFLLK